MRTDTSHHVHMWSRLQYVIHSIQHTVMPYQEHLIMALHPTSSLYVIHSACYVVLLQADLIYNLGVILPIYSQMLHETPSPPHKLCQVQTLPLHSQPQANLLYKHAIKQRGQYLSVETTISPIFIFLEHTELTQQQTSTSDKYFITIPEILIVLIKKPLQNTHKQEFMMSHILIQIPTFRAYDRDSSRKLAYFNSFVRRNFHRF